MLQTGTLYSIVNNESSIESQEPIPNVYIYFSQNNVRKLTTKTDAQGKFSFDLPLGSYQVTVSQGATSQVYQLAGGAPFELTSASGQSAFEEWVLAPIYLKPEENPLVVLMNNLVLDARASATEAKAEADRAEQAVSDSQGTGKLARMSEVEKKIDKSDTVGSGKVMRESEVVSNSHDVKLKSDDEILNYLRGSTGAGRIVRLTIYSGLTVPAYSAGITGKTEDTWFCIALDYKTSTPYFMAGNQTLSYHSIGLTNKNTTVDSNGFIKSASPIIRLFDDRIEANDSFKGEPGFKKIDTGVYQISGTLGLAKEGWYIETPRDRNGFPYFLVEWGQDEDNVVTIRTFKRKIDLETLDFVNGEPVDIGEDQRWIDLRFHEEPEEFKGIEEVEEA